MTSMLDQRGRLGAVGRQLLNVSPFQCPPLTLPQPTLTTHSYAKGNWFSRKLFESLDENRKVTEPVSVPVSQ